MARLATSIRVLKETAKDIRAPIKQIAINADVSVRVVTNVLKDFAAKYSAEVEESGDFPEALILQFTDTNTSTSISFKEFEALKPLAEQLLEQGVTESDSDDDVDNEEPIIETVKPVFETEKDKSVHYTKADSIMSTTPPPRGYRSAPGIDMNYSQQGVHTADLTTNEKLMKWVLGNTRGVPANQIDMFMNVFAADEDGFVREPTKLLTSLVYGFGPAGGEAAFHTFMNLRPKYVQNFGMEGRTTGMGYGGGTAITPYGQASQDPQAMMMQNPAYRRMMEEDMMEEMRDRREERKENRVYRQMNMRNLNSMMQAQIPMNPMGGGMGMGGVPMGSYPEETYDKDGNIISRRFHPVTPGGSQGTSDVVHVLSEQNRILLDKSQDFGKEMRQVYKDALDAAKGNGNDFFATSKKFKEAGIDLFGGRGGSESPESLKLKFDISKDLWDSKMKYRTQQHEWNREKEDKITSQENMREWIGILKESADGFIAGPLAEFSRGAGLGFGKKKAMQQGQMNAQQQQAYAAYQQQQDMARQQQAMAQRQAMAAQGGGYGVQHPEMQGQPQYNPYQPQPQPYQAQPQYQQQPNPYQQPQYQQQPQPQRQTQPQPQQQRPQSAAEQLMRQNMLDENWFLEASEEELMTISQDFDRGISRLIPVKNRTDQELKKRRIYKERRQAEDFYRKQDLEQQARERIEAQTQVAQQQVRKPVAPVPQQVQEEIEPEEPEMPTVFVPANLGRDEPVVKAVAPAPEVPKPAAQPQPEPAAEKETMAEPDDGGEDDDGDDDGPEVGGEGA